MKNSLRRGLGIAAALAILVVIAAPKLMELRRASAQVLVGPSKTTLRVKVHRVAPLQLTERLATTGTLRANEKVEIVSEISGKISAILFEEGSRVAAGELLLKIDDTELAAERLRAVHGSSSPSETKPDRTSFSRTVSSAAKTTTWRSVNSTSCGPNSS